MQTGLIIVLALALALLGGEWIHCRVSDYLERRAVKNAWSGCVSVAGASAPSRSSFTAIHAQADLIFNDLKANRPPGTLPRHILGTPASDLIARYS